MSSDHYLDPDSVVDRESFMRFAEALIRDREEAEELERQSPEQYRWGGANDWQNGSISQYLGCALAGAEAQREGWGSDVGVSWRELAILLWLGKIYE
jgi:hypothetical protein